MRRKVLFFYWFASFIFDNFFCCGIMSFQRSSSHVMMRDDMFSHCWWLLVALLCSFSTSGTRWVKSRMWNISSVKMWFKTGNHAYFFPLCYYRNVNKNYSVHNNHEKLYRPCLIVHHRIDLPTHYSEYYKMSLHNGIRYDWSNITRIWWRFHNYGKCSYNSRKGSIKL